MRARSYLKESKREDGQRPDSDLRQLEFKKNQYGPISDTILLRYRHGMFLPEVGALTLDALKQMEIAKEVFLTLLDRYNQSNRTVSDQDGCQLRACTILRGGRGEEGWPERTNVREAMVQLYRDQKIWNEPCGKPSRPAYRIARGMNPELKEHLERCKREAAGGAK